MLILIFFVIEIFFFLGKWIDDEIKFVPIFDAVSPYIVIENVDIEGEEKAYNRHIQEKTHIFLISNTDKAVCDCTIIFGNDLCVCLYEPRHEKTGFLHMRKQRRRSAAQSLRS